MNCARINRLLSAYLDGELSGAEMLAVREHVKGCTSCEAELRAARLVKSSLSRLQPVRPSAGFEERLVALIQGSAAPARPDFMGWLRQMLMPRLEPSRLAVYGCACLLLFALGRLPQSSRWQAQDGLAGQTSPAAVAFSGERPAADGLMLLGPRPGYTTQNWAPQQADMPFAATGPRLQPVGYTIQGGLNAR